MATEYDTCPHKKPNWACDVCSATCEHGYPLWRCTQPSHRVAQPDTHYAAARRGQGEQLPPPPALPSVAPAPIAAAPVTSPSVAPFVAVTGFATFGLLLWSLLWTVLTLVFLMWVVTLAKGLVDGVDLPAAVIVGACIIALAKR